MSKNPYQPRSKPDAEFPDFEERLIDYVENERSRRLLLLLPATEEVDLLLEQRAQAAQDEEDQREEARAQRLDAKAGSKMSGVDPGRTGYVSQKEKDRLAATDARAQMQLDFELTRNKVRADEGYERHQVQVYAWDAPLKLIEDRKASPDRELRERDKELFGQLQKLGAFRWVCTWERMEIVLGGLRYLRASQPHFARVVDLVEARVRLAQELDQPMRIPPVLLAGPPGVGKTHFTLELARVLERPVRRHSFDSAHTASALMGSDRNWASTRYGLIFDAVCLGERADPVVLLDELDKVAEHTYGGSPLAPLHSLLEPVTSATVTDISAGIQFDASHVFFVATANDLRLVPPPIQSRFQVFRIESPTAEQSIDLAQSVSAVVHLRYSGFEEPPRRLVTLLAHLTPREQVQALEHAYAQAVVNGRKNLMRQDLPAAVLQDDGAELASGHFLH